MPPVPSKIHRGLEILAGCVVLAGCGDTSLHPAGDLSVLPGDGGVSDLARDGGGHPDLAGCTGSETFQAARQAMLSSCSGFGPMSCHSREPFDASLDLTAAHAWAQLVNVPATQAPAKRRVIPGDLDGSFLYQKLTNTQGPDEGAPMPKGEGIIWRPPPDDQLRVLRCWILAGARND